MASKVGTAAVVRAVFTAVVILLAAIVLCYCALIGLWILTIANTPQAGTGSVLEAMVVLGVIALLAIGAVLVQLRWSNRATEVGTITRRSLLTLAMPGAVVLVFALTAAW